ncbi:hydrophobin-251 [Armillaria fumosa]|nr:hydrophobin-251 [Armillaria fumosa]
MFSRISAFTLAILALPLLVASSAVPQARTNTTVTGGKCNRFSAMLQPKSDAVQNALGLLGIPIGDITANVGLTCGPITVISLGTTSCANQPVCCEKNNFNGLVALGCTPLNVVA